MKSGIEYVTSTDYKRLVELLDAGAEIACSRNGLLLWLVADKMADCEDGSAVYRICDSEGFSQTAALWSEDDETAASFFIAECQRHRIEFIDPASQSRPRENHVIADMPMGEMLKHIPGGAYHDEAERYFESLAWESNGESMHESYGDGVTAAEALLRLYGRIKQAESR